MKKKCPHKLFCIRFNLAKTFDIFEKILELGLCNQRKDQTIVY